MKQTKEQPRIRLAHARMNGSARINQKTAGQTTRTIGIRGNNQQGCLPIIKMTRFEILFRHYVDHLDDTSCSISIQIITENHGDDV